jgi:hypothetical protein
MKRVVASRAASAPPAGSGRQGVDLRELADVDVARQHDGGRHVELPGQLAGLARQRPQLVVDEYAVAHRPRDVVAGRGGQDDHRVRALDAVAHGRHEGRAVRQADLRRRLLQQRLGRVEQQPVAREADLAEQGVHGARGLGGRQPGEARRVDLHQAGARLPGQRAGGERAAVAGRAGEQQDHGGLHVVAVVPGPACPGVRPDRAQRREQVREGGGVLGRQRQVLDADGRRRAPGELRQAGRDPRVALEETDHVGRRPQLVEQQVVRRHVARVQRDQRAVGERRARPEGAQGPQPLAAPLAEQLEGRPRRRVATPGVLGGAREQLLDVVVELGGDGQPERLLVEAPERVPPPQPVDRQVRLAGLAPQQPLQQRGRAHRALGRRAVAAAAQDEPVQQDLQPGDALGEVADGAIGEIGGGEGAARHHQDVTKSTKSPAVWAAALYAFLAPSATARIFSAV